MSARRAPRSKRFRAPGVRRFFASGCDDRAQGLVEYAFIVAFVALIMIAALKTVQQRTTTSLSSSAAALS